MNYILDEVEKLETSLYGIARMGIRPTSGVSFEVDTDMACRAEYAYKMDK